ncbi:Disease resistance protein [Nymphaea thermarum]|nr:Disease resistance protein [Nymphaea thermarum]
MPKELRWLEWHGCPLRSLPDYVTLDKVAVLDLSKKELPDSIGNMTKLEELDLNGCERLGALPASLGNMEDLTELDLNGMLERLPDQIGRMTKLEKLDLRFCKSLRTLPDSIGNMTNLVELDISFTGIEHLPGSIVYLEKLTTLRMMRCTKPGGLPLGRTQGLQRLLVMGKGEKEFKHEHYYEVSERISQKSGYCQQTQEFRMIQFTCCKEEHSVWDSGGASVGQVWASAHASPK